MSDITNETRANRALKVLQYYRDLTDEVNEDFDTSLVDLLVDVRHLIDKLDLPLFLVLDDRALAHYQAEIEEAYLAGPPIIILRESPTDESRQAREASRADEKAPRRKEGEGMNDTCPDRERTR